VTQYSLDDLLFNLSPTQCCDPSSPFFGCTGQELLEARYAAEYVKLGPHVSCELWISADQFERRPEGPDPTDAPGEQWDPVYGEPTLHVRQQTEEQVEEGWDFRGPYPFLALLSDSSSDYFEDEKGGSKNRTITMLLAKYAICQAVAAGVGGGVNAGNGLGCPSDAMLNPFANLTVVLPGQALPEESEVFRGDRPRHGDVIYVASGWNEFFDVDGGSRRGYTQGAKTHTYFELELSRRSKYLPRRKDILPNAENRALGNPAGTEFLRDDQRPSP